LIIDNVGSGLFLPLTVVFIVRCAGLSVSLAGTLLTVGTLVGLLAPAAVGRASGRIDARPVVIAALLLQAAGMGCYLLAHGAVLVVIAAALVAAGTQTFYSGLFALVSDVAAAGPKDRPFAAVTMARAAAFGTGNLLAALLLAVVGTAALRPAAALDAVTFLVAAAVLHSTVVPRLLPGDVVPAIHPRDECDRVTRNHPFVVLIVAVGLLTLATDFLLVGMPTYAIEVVRTAAWVPSLCIALLTAATSTLSGWTLRTTWRWRRTTALTVAGGWFIAWCGVTAGTGLVPDHWATPWLLASTPLVIAGSLVAGTRANAIAEAAAPPRLRGRYLAAFQYSFTVAGLVAPLIVAAFSVASWFPWLIVAVCVALGMATLPWLARTLPSQAVESHVRARFLP
jgi:MFS family permease